MTVIESVVLHVASQVATTALKDWWLGRKSDGKVEIALPDGSKIELDQHQFHQLEMAERIDAARRLDPQDPELTQRGESLLREIAGAVALTDTDEFFRRARKRIDLVFRIRLGVTLIIAMILVFSAGGAIIGLMVGHTALATGLGATALADLLGASLYKPLDKFRQALVDTQRLDAIHLMAKQQLSACRDQEPQARFKCQARVWRVIMDQLATLERTGDSA